MISNNLKEKIVTKAFITFEGCEGVGKSTQLSLLKDYLEKTGQTALFTREPGGTATAEKIREIILGLSSTITPLVEAYLFAAARADHVENVIMPALDKGMLVICDRFLDSSVAYQGYGRGLGEAKVYDINRHAFGVTPDCTVFIDMEPRNSWRKQKGKTIENDRMENESETFHDKVYEGFKSIYKDNQRAAVIVPDEDKMITHKKIVTELRNRGYIV